MKGALCSWWKRNFGICEEIDTTFGHKPNESTWDANFRKKRLACHEDSDHLFRVFDSKMNVIDYENFMRVLIEEVKVCCCLRSAKEPTYIERGNWEFFIIQEGHFKGTPACRLNPDHAGQKNKALTMSNHTANDNLKNVQHLPILKTNKKFDTYTMIYRQLYEFLPPDKHIYGLPRMFRKEASPKQIKVSFIVVVVSVCSSSLLLLLLSSSYQSIYTLTSMLFNSPHYVSVVAERIRSGLYMES